MFKRTISLLLVGVFILSNTIMALASQNSLNIEQRMDSAIFLYVGSPFAYVNNVRNEVDPSNSKIVPVVKNGRTLVPVRFIAESLGADVNWDAASNTVVVKLNDKNIKLVLGQKVITVNNINTAMEVPAQIISSRTFIPLRALVEALGQQVTYINGLIIISSEGNLIDVQSEIDLVNSIIAMFNPMKSIAGGYSFSASVGVDGTVWTWGDNYFGQLGDGTSTPKSIPGKVNGLTGIKEIVCGAHHTLALKEDGTVWAWGHNMNYQLGNDTRGPSNKTPYLVKGLTNVKSLAAGKNHSVALKNDGTVWTWGRNWECQLGRKPSENQSAAPGMIEELTGIVSIAAMGDVTAALKNDGTVWICGDIFSEYQIEVLKAYGLDGVKSIALTNNNIVALKSDGTVLLFNIYSRKIKMVPNFTDIKMIACNHNQIAALKNDGSLWLSWKMYAVSDFLTSPDPEYETSRKINGLTDVQTIAAGYNHVMILKNDGTVWGLGNNTSGQIGNHKKIFRNVPYKVAGLSKTIAIDASANQSIALLGNGSVSVWGEDVFYSYFWENNSTPKAISGLGRITAVSSTSGEYAVIKSDGTVWHWGSNAGDVPVKVETLKNITAICGDDTGFEFAALKNDGTVWGWSDNLPPSGPFLTRGISDAIAVGKGRCFTLALKKDGTVWSWSEDGDPEKIPELSNVIALSTDSTICMGLKSDGTVWRWEVDNRGNFNGKPPVQINGLSSIVAISGSSTALKHDGTVWTWGDNKYGQLGDGTTVNKNNPVKVSGLSNIVKLASGDYHSLALDENGTVWSWGRNDEGQLGDGTVLYEDTPVQSFFN